MTKEKTYRVAGHTFTFRIEEDSFLWSKAVLPYGPFEVESCSSDHEHVFTLTVLPDIVSDGGARLVYSNRKDVEPGFILIDVYDMAGLWYFELTCPGSSAVNCRLVVDMETKEARMSLHGRDSEKWAIFNSGVDFCFLMTTACRDTVLTHASSVIHEGKAYLFLGKSGTGKSTHSRMWLNALEGVVLMNDDHPVIRLDEDGNPVAYGSPWSGKTPCYKNMSAPLGGIIRISRAPYNRPRRLSPVEAYASVMTSCSGMTWDRQLADGRDRTMQGIISRTPCWVMECLPDEDAAHVCSDAVTACWK